MAELSAEPHETIISPEIDDWRQSGKELWEYRDLLALLVRRDFSARYKQTLLGPAWFILQPLLTTLVFVIVFERVAKLPSDDLPAPLFYLSGLLGWNYFANSLTAGGGTFVNNAHLFTKVYFPRLILPLATIVANLFTLLLQFIPFIAIFAYYKLAGTGAAAWSTDARLLLLPLPILHIALLALGLSLWISAATSRFRDLIHLNQFLIQLGMFVTPIIYPLSSVAPKWQPLFFLNPMSVPIESFRLCLLGRGTLDPLAIAWSAGITLLVLVTGVAAFRKVEGTMADSV